MKGQSQCQGVSNDVVKWRDCPNAQILKHFSKGKSLQELCDREIYCIHPLKHPFVEAKP